VARFEGMSAWGMLNSRLHAAIENDAKMKLQGCGDLRFLGSLRLDELKKATVRVGI
jgi:hypothetical protein